MWWDPQQKKWVGYDVPDFAATKPPTAKAQPNGIGLDAHDGADPFIMLQDGVGWLYVPSGLVDGPLPAHYEPAKSPVRNPLYKQQSSPVLKYWAWPGNELAQVGDVRFPHVITTYRLTEPLPGRRDEPVAAVAHGAAARVVHRAEPRAGRREGHP